MMFYLLQHPSERIYRYAWKDESFIGCQRSQCEECGRTVSSIEYRGSHHLIVEGGPKYPDHLAFCGAGEPLFVISERAARIFREHELSGITEFIPIRVAKEITSTLVPLPETAPNYVLVQIVGRIDLDHGKMCLKKKRVCKTCGGFEWNRQRMNPLYMDESTWDGSDICRNESIPGYIIFSKAAVDLVKKYKLKGFSFEPLDR